MARQIVELREERGVTQRALAIAADIDPAHLSRIERGSAAASVAVLVAVAAGLGADLSVRLFPTAGPRLRDRFQAPIVEALIRLLHPRWTPIPEQPVPAARGVIDLVLALRGSGLGIACEVHSELRSIDLVLRRLAEKALALGDLERFQAPASSLLLVRSTTATRAVARLHAATLAAAFPSSYASALAALTGSAPWPGPSLLWARIEAGRAVILDRPPRGLAVGR